MAVDAVRVLAGLNTGAWDQTAVVGGLIRAAHVQELRTRLNEALVELSLPLPAYTDAVLSVGVTGIKRAHIAELRAGATRGSGAAQGGSTGGAVHIQWLVTDHLGTPRIIADLSGSLVGIKRHDYLPFGEELAAGTGGRTTAQGYSQVDNVRQKFAASERDGETGLDFMQARYYSSTMGRFTSVDKFFFQQEMLTDPQRFNLYVYVRNNPLRFIDPTGDAIQLIGTEEERKRLLQALKDGAGKAGDRLYENKVVEKDGTVRYFVGINGKPEDFAQMNNVAGELAPIIADTKIAALQYVEDNSNITTSSGETMRLSSTGKSGSNLAFADNVHENLVNIYIAKPKSGAGYEDVLGIKMSDGKPGSRDLASIAYHELGHARAYMTGDVGPVSKMDAVTEFLRFPSTHRETQAALRLENKVRKLRDPSAAIRKTH